MVLTNSRNRVLWGAGGLLAGVALGAITMMSLRGGDGPYSSSPPHATRSMGAASADASAFVTAVASNCDMAPMLPTAGEGDDRVVLQTKPAASSSEVASLILSGKEAAAAGRRRDAEVSFLNACRSAAALRDGDGLPLADAMYQLGRHYANAAAFGASRSRELLERAERLYSASLEGYRTRLGPAHEKTRFAQEGLVTVQQVTGGQGAAVAKAPPAPAAAPLAAPPPAEVAKAPKPAKPPVPAAPPVAQRAMKTPAAREQPKAAPEPATRAAAADPADNVVAAPAPRPPRRVHLPEREPDHAAAPPAASMGASGGGEVPTAEGSVGQP